MYFNSKQIIRDHPWVRGESVYVSSWIIKPHHSLEPKCSSSTLGLSLHSLCSLPILLVCLALPGVKHTVVGPFQFADWWGNERRYAFIYSEGRTEVRMTASWCRHNDQSQGHRHSWIASGLPPCHSYLSAFNKRHFLLPGGWRSNIIYLWFGIWQEISNLPKEVGQGKGERTVTGEDLWAFAKVFLRAPLFLETDRKQNKQKTMFEDEALFLMLRISTLRGFVQASQRKLGFSISLQEQMFVSAVLARSLGKEHK